MKKTLLYLTLISIICIWVNFSSLSKELEEYEGVTTETDVIYYDKYPTEIETVDWESWVEEELEEIKNRLDKLKEE